MSIVFNRKVLFNYEILEKCEAGIVLQGNEVKSIRQGKVSIAEAFITIKSGEAFLHNMTIETYDKVSHNRVEPSRTRKLLLKKNEIFRLDSKVKEKGLTLIPLSLYYKQSNVKCEIALGKGKKLFDKRESIKQKTLKRDIDRQIKGL